MTVRYTRRAAKEMEDLPLEDQQRVLEAMDLAEELRQSLKEVEADGDTLALSDVLKNVGSSTRIHHQTRPGPGQER